MREELPLALHRHCKRHSPQQPHSPAQRAGPFSQPVPRPKPVPPSLPLPLPLALSCCRTSRLPSHSFCPVRGVSTLLLSVPKAHVAVASPPPRRPPQESLSCHAMLPALLEYLSPYKQSSPRCVCVWLRWQRRRSLEPEKVWLGRRVARARGSDPEAKDCNGPFQLIHSEERRIRVSLKHQFDMLDSKADSKFAHCCPV